MFELDGATISLVLQMKQKFEYCKICIFILLQYTLEQYTLHCLFNVINIYNFIFLNINYVWVLFILPSPPCRPVEVFDFHDKLDRFHK